jgi:ATP-dependent helicase/DNAse subunit B
MLILSQIVNDIASGNIASNPHTRGSSHNACSYCPYEQICHIEQLEGRRDYAAMKAEEFWDRIRRKVAENG